MIRTTRHRLTPHTTAMNREAILAHVCEIDPRSARWHREQADQGWPFPVLWPVIERYWTDEFIYGYDETDRPLVNTRTIIIWEED